LPRPSVDSAFPYAVVLIGLYLEGQLVAAIVIASARLSFAFSNDLISFSEGTRSGSVVRCAKANVTAHTLRSATIVGLRRNTVDLLSQFDLTNARR
jgi:hypothetical protein